MGSMNGREGALNFETRSRQILNIWDLLPTPAFPKLGKTWHCCEGKAVLSACVLWEDLTCPGLFSFLITDTMIPAKDTHPTPSGGTQGALGAP